jgi:hypothetical protein
MKIVSTRKLITSSLTVFAITLAACNQTPDSVSTVPTNMDSLPAIPTRGQLKARDFGTAAYDSANGIAANATGVYVVGETNGSLDGPNKGDTDGFVRKYDGGVVWAQQFGTRAFDRAVSVTVDASGNSYLVGTTVGALGFKVGSSDSFLRKYNASGTVQWTRQFGTLGTDYVLDVALDAGGSIFALSQDDATGFVLRKFGPTGTLLASKIVPSATLPGLIPKALAIDSSGNVIVLAEWYDSGTSGNNVRLFKFTNALISVWSAPYQTNFNDFAYDIATFGTDIYITARINTPTAGFGARYVKLNSAGTIVLTRQLEPISICNCTNPQSMAVDASGNIYVAADVYGSFFGFTNAGGSDIVAFKYDSAGTRLWVRQLGAGTNGTTLGDFTKAVAVSDAVYVAGNSLENLLGDPKYGGVGDTDAYLVQLDKTTGQIIGIDQ